MSEQVLRHDYVSLCPLIQISIVLHFLVLWLRKLHEQMFQISASATRILCANLIL